MTPSIGVNLPGAAELERLGPGGLAAAAGHAERLGFDSVWMPDLVTGDGSPAAEGVVALAAAAGATDRIGLGFGVLVLPLRPIAWLAAQLQTLQHVSGERALLGVGSGGFPDTPFWRALGVDPAERGRHTDAALTALPQLITGGSTRVGRAADAPVVTLGPPAAAPPVLVGGTSDLALRRAARHGDGWFPSLSPPSAVARGAERLRALAAEHGRRVPGITLGAHVVSGDDDAAREAFARSLVEDHGRDPQEAAQLLISGTEQDIAARFAEYAEAGVERLVVAPTGDEPWMRQCERIAAARALLGAPAETPRGLGQ